MAVKDNLSGGKGKSFFTTFKPTSSPVTFDIGFEPDYAAWHTNGTYGSYNKESYYVKGKGYSSGSSTFDQNPSFPTGVSWMKIEGTKIIISNFPQDLNTDNLLMAFKE